MCVHMNYTTGSDNRRCNSLSTEKQDFVRMLQTFRPAQTVFETGIGTGTASTNTGQGHGGDLRSKTKLTSQVQMMKALRDANNMHLERNRVRGDAKRKREEEDEEEEEEGEGDEEEDGEGGSGENDDEDDDDDEKDEDEDNGSLFDAPSIAPPQQPPPRVSMAERRKLKKQGLSSQEVQARVAELKKRGLDEGSDDASYFGSSDVAVSHGGVGGGMSSGIDGFKDRRFYMSYGTEDERANFSEEAMQPKAGLRDGETQAAMRLEHAMLDIAPDEAMELNKKKRVMRWDAKKRKFVKQSLSEIAAGGGRDGKRVRSESGVVASSKKKPVGDMYDRWKKKSHREVGGISTDGDNSPRPNFKSNRHVKDELRGPAELAKLQKKKSNIKMKNMTKEKRTSLEVIVFCC
jgi:ATP-dependent RNA helicase DDX54/DBP10